MSEAGRYLEERDFGNSCELVPRERVRVRSPADVIETIARARRLALPVVARGQGHSTRGQSLTEHGLLIDTAELDLVRIEGESAVVGAGARWDNVVRAALAHGLMPPVLTDYLGLSVGGTLSLGGVGGSSFRHGTQTDNVLELSVVTGRADLIRCSRLYEPALFDACRAGLGHAGVIVEARLRLIEAPTQVRVVCIDYDELDACLDDQLRLCERGGFDEVRGSVQLDGATPRFRIEAAQYLFAGCPRTLDARGLCGRLAEIREQEFFEYATRLRALERDMHIEGTWHDYHPWFDMFVPGSSARQSIASALDQLRGLGLESGHVMMYPLRAAACRTPLLPVPADPHGFLFDVLPDVRARASLPAWQDYAKRVFDQARARGARMYPIGYPVGTPDADWQQHFGAAWPALVGARAAHDPDRLFARMIPREPSARTATLGELAALHVQRLAAAIGQPSQVEALCELGALMSGGWWNDALTARPGWTSDLSDDGTPFELSLTFSGGEPELRMLVEPRPVSKDARSNFEHALQIGRRLADQHGAEVSLLEQVARLFAPHTAEGGRFLLWYAVHLRAGRPFFKVYLNPELDGLEHASGKVCEALTQLGHLEAWARLQERRTNTTRMPFFSVDLSAPDDARIKVYLAHPEDVLDAVERATSTSNFAPGQARRLLQALLQRPEQSADRSVLTCHAFKQGAREVVTLHVPVRSHVVDDREALHSMRALCRDAEGRLIERALLANAKRPLEAGRGLLAYVALRPTEQGRHDTVYIAPEAYAVAARRPRAMAVIGDIRRTVELEQARYAAEPFFTRLARDASGEQVRTIARRLGFFIVTFQDMLRLASTQCTTQAYAEALRAHEREDLGHERWYFADLKRMGVTLALNDVLERETREVRDVSYAIMSLVLHARSDAARLAIVLALEGAGHEFFGRFIPLAQRTFPELELVFFGTHHREVEASHSIEVWDELFARPVDSETLHEMTTVVRRVFAEMTRVARAMELVLALTPTNEVRASTP